MAWQFRLFLIVPLVVLAGRAILSRDPRWKRVAAGALVLVAAVAQPWLIRELTVRDGGYPTYYQLLEALSLLAFYGASLVLILWAYASRDPRGQRLVSAIAGLFGLWPLLITVAGSLPAMFASAHEGTN